MVEKLLELMALKDEKRTGQQLYSIQNPDSVAGHSWSVSFLTLVTGEEMDINMENALKIAAVHDLAEAKTGDIATRAHKKNKISGEEKEKMEKEAMEEFSTSLETEFNDLWRQYSNTETMEACLVKDMDKIERCLTALKNEKEENYDLQDNQSMPYEHLDEFLMTCEGKFQTEIGKKLYSDIKEKYEAAKTEDCQIKDQKISFLLKILNLKDEERTGWVLRGIEDPESVASHSWGSMIQTILNIRSELDREKVLKMALVHDLEQAETGDIPSRGDKEKKVMATGEKEGKEVEAMKQLIPGELERLFELWKEHMEMETEEACFVEDMEQIDMSLQALRYEKRSRYNPEDNPEFSRYEAMDEFFISAEENIQTEKGRKLFKKIESKYKEVK